MRGKCGEALGADHILGAQHALLVRSSASLRGPFAEEHADVGHSSQCLKLLSSSRWLPLLSPGNIAHKLCYLWWQRAAELRSTAALCPLTGKPVAHSLLFRSIEASDAEGNQVLLRGLAHGGERVMPPRRSSVPHVQTRVSCVAACCVIRAHTSKKCCHYKDLRARARTFC